MCHVDHGPDECFAPAEAPDAPWITENWHSGFHNAVKIGKIEQGDAIPRANPPRFVANDADWPYRHIPQDLAEWFFDHTVIGARKHIDPYTGVISIIFLADSGEQYVADDFDLGDLICEPRSTADWLHRLPRAVSDEIRARRAAKTPKHA